MTCSGASLPLGQSHKPWGSMSLVTFASTLSALLAYPPGPLSPAGHPAPFLSPSSAGRYASRSVLSYECVGWLSFPGTFSTSLGVVLRSSHTLPRSVRMARSACCILRWCIRACFPRVCQHRRSTSLPLRICRDGLVHSSACTYRLDLAPRTFLPRAVFRQRIVLSPVSRPRLSCSSPFKTSVDRLIAPLS